MRRAHSAPQNPKRGWRIRTAYRCESQKLDYSARPAHGTRTAVPARRSGVRRRDLPDRWCDRQVGRLLLPLGQLDVAELEGLVGHLAQEVGDDVEPAAPLVV